MKITIPYDFIEEHAWCEKEGKEYYPYAYDTDLEFDVDECEFEYSDLKDIAEAYTDDIIDIILGDEQLTNALLKKLRSRKIDVSTITNENGEKNTKR